MPDRPFTFHPDSGEPVTFKAVSTKAAQEYAAARFHGIPGTLLDNDPPNAWRFDNNDPPAHGDAFDVVVTIRLLAPPAEAAEHADRLAQLVLADEWVSRVSVSPPIPTGGVL